MAELRIFFPDILAIIFQHCFTDSNTDSNFKIFKRDAPLNVSATCRLWRDTALHTPSLWKHISIQRSSKRALGWFNREMPEMLNTWIPRSGAQPLAIIVNCFLCRDNSSESLDVVVPQLLGCKDRWESLSIFAPNQGFCRTLLSQDLSPAPKLKWVDVRMPPGHCIDFKTTIPSIQHISFRGYTLHMDRSCSALKSLTAKLTRATVSKMVPQLPQLEMLYVECSETTPEVPHTTVFLPKLKELNLKLYHRERISQYQVDPFFTHLVMPNLTKLRVCIDGEGRLLSYALRDVSGLLVVSQPELQSLEMIYDGTYMTSDECEKLFEIFRESPFLHTLQLPKATMRETIIDGLVRRRGEPVLLPALHTLHSQTRYPQLMASRGLLPVSSVRALIQSRVGHDGISVYCRTGKGVSWELLSVEDNPLPMIANMSISVDDTQREEDSDLDFDIPAVVGGLS